MEYAIKKYPEHACQFCGSEFKLVETLINDEFFWNEHEKMYQPHEFSDDFEHTGNQWCGQCEKEWTGL